MDVPLYNGARPQLDSTPQPLQTPGINLEANMQAVQRGAQALDAAIGKFKAIQDFGEDQRIEGILNQTNADFEQEFTRRASLAPGSEEGLYDEEGHLHRGHLDALVKDFSNRVDEIRPGYLNPDARLKANALLQGTKQQFGIRGLGKAAEREIQVSRQTYQDNLKMALDRKDYGAARDLNQRARKNEVISQNQYEYENWKFNQLDRVEQFQEGLKKNPLAVAAALEDGLYDDIEPDVRRDLEKDLQTALRQQVRQIPFTEEERKVMEGGGSVRPKFDRQAGDTEQMVKWREAKNQGMLHLHQQEIDAAWKEDVYNAPVLKSAGQYNVWKNHLIRTWCDEKTGFGVNPELLSLAADERIGDLMGFASAKDHLNAAEFFKAVDPADIAPEFYKKWDQAKGTWYWTDAGRKEKEEGAKKAYDEKAQKARSEAYAAYLFWAQSNPKASYYEQYQKACSLLADRASRLGEENEVEKADLEFKYMNRDLGNKGKQKGQEALEEQQKRNKEYRKKTAEGIAAADKARVEKASPVLPAVMATDIQPVPDEEPGAYLSREDYEKVVEFYGDAPELVGVLPGRGSQRACCRVPVLGWHEGEGVLLTRGARHGQLGVVGRIDGLEVRFRRPKESKILPPEERKKWMDGKRRKREEPALLPPLDASASVPPEEYGLLPAEGAGVEIAAPVSESGLPPL